MKGSWFRAGAECETRRAHSRWRVLCIKKAPPDDESDGALAGHGCGYKLANDRHDTRAIQDFLGHKNIMHTVRYTELASERFKNFWRRGSGSNGTESRFRICRCARHAWTSRHINGLED